MRDRAQARRVQPTAQAPARRWLLFVHQLPSQPSNLRVRTWRRLQQLGAIPLKQAVYVLPGHAGGARRLRVAEDGSEGRRRRRERLRRRQRRRLVGRRAGRGVPAVASGGLRRAGARRRAGAEAAERRRRPAARARRRSRRLLDIFRERLAAIERIDFFGSAGRDRVMTLLEQLEDRTSARATGERRHRTGRRRGAAAYHGRLWITRPRPGVDRMASAWLIRRFIDPQARFGFAADRDAVPDDGVPFDMFGVEFSHQGDGCTFETLVRGVRHPASRRCRASPPSCTTSISRTDGSARRRRRPWAP